MSIRGCASRCYLYFIRITLLQFLKMELSEAQIQNRQNCSALSRVQVDIEADNVPQDLWLGVRGYIWNISHRYTQFHHPILLFECDLHDLWYMLIKAAKVTGADDPLQDRLLIQVLYARELGTLKWTSASSDSNDMESHIALTSNGRIWTDLPFLAGDIQEVWSKFLSIKSQERVNLAAFIAKLTALGVCGDALSLCAISLLRETLETQRRLTASESGSDVPVAELLPAVNAWLEHAGHKLIALSNNSFNNFELKESVLARDANISSGGFNPTRWLFWKQRLEALSQCDDEIVARGALFGFRIMSQRLLEIESAMSVMVDNE